MSATHRLPHGFSFLRMTLNMADRTASLWLQGQIAAITAQELIEDCGFTQVDVRERSIVAWLNGYRFELDGSFHSSAMEAA